MNSRALKVILLFILSYGAICALSIMNNSSGNPLPLLFMDFSGFPGKADYSLLLMPVAGFFFIYLLVPYLKTEFGFGKIFVKFVFPVGFLVFCILAFIVAVYVFYLDIALRVGLGFDLTQFNLDYMRMFLGSTFIYFMLGGILGWASRQLIDHFEGQK